MSDSINVGKAFPLEKLASDITRNNYNYQSILTGLIKWNNTTEDSVTIRLTKDSAPWYEDYTIPSKKSVLTLNDSSVFVSSSIHSDNFDVESILSCTVATGIKNISETSFIILTGSDDIELSDADDFDINDAIIFIAEDGSTLPTVISENSLYYIVSKVNNTIKLSSEYQGDPLTIVDGSGTIDIYKFNSTPIVLDDGSADLMTARISINNNGDTNWGLYYMPVVYEYSVNTVYKAGQYVSYDNILYRAIFDVSETTSLPADLPNLFRKLIYTWESGENYYAGDIVIDSTTTYAYLVLRDVMDSEIRPENDTDNFEFYAKPWVQYSTYTKGSYVMYTNGTITKFYLAVNDIVNSSVSPDSDTFTWNNELIFYVPSGLSITQSIVVRWTPTTDISSFILRNTGDSVSTSDTSITIKITIKTKELDSIYQKSVGIFPNSNYTMWPDDNSSVWLSEHTYGPTDTTIPISKRQSYSASMIFDHTNMKTAKTVNYISYNGPDLDQGLCIYLPVEVDVGDGGIAYPEDGFTYDFFFRIWPNSVFNGQITRDHTVNKSQIYVYSVLNRDNVLDDICENPIAKFSMARTTNFYMFGENVSIPDKPVCYRATFVYSSAEKKWNCLDYYQLPDHIFVGPVGFIDPQSPANLDINNDTIGNINPNASFIGYETAAFPLFQDPFSKTDLTPYRFESDEDFESFKNRMI